MCECVSWSVLYLHARSAHSFNKPQTSISTPVKLSWHEWNSRYVIVLIPNTRLVSSISNFKVFCMTFPDFQPIAFRSRGKHSIQRMSAVIIFYCFPTFFYTFILFALVTDKHFFFCVCVCSIFFPSAWMLSVCLSRVPWFSFGAQPPKNWSSRYETCRKLNTDPTKRSQSSGVELIAEFR